MPASVSAIMKNVERLSGDAELLALWNAAATEDRMPGAAWLAFIEAADAVQIADRIPGSVGRQFRAKYAATPPSTAPASRRPAPASAGASVGGTGRRGSTAPRKAASK